MRPPEIDNIYLCMSCDHICDDAFCGNCGGPTVAVSPELLRVRESIQVRANEITALRRELDTAQRQLDQLWAKHNELVTAARHHYAAAQAPPAAPAPPPTPDSPAPPSPPVAPAPPPPESSARSVQQLLLWMGAILSGAAIIAFTAVAWTTFGLAGRAMILTTVTAMTMVVPLWVRRRGLTSTAETLAGIAMVMVACDAVAVYYLEVLPSPDTVIGEAASGGADTVLEAFFGAGIYSPTALSLGLVVVLVALVYHATTKLVVPGFVAAILGLGVTVLACAQDELLLGAGACLFAALLLGASAAWSARQANTRPRRALVHANAAVGVGVVETAAVYSSGDYTLVTVTGVTAGLLAAISFLLPVRWRVGPVAVTGAVWTIATVVVALVFAYATVTWLLASTPIWTEPTTAPALSGPANWELTLAVVFTGCGIGTVLSRRLHVPLLAAGASATIMTLPPALALPYQGAAPLMTFFAVMAAALATRRRGRTAAGGLGLAGVLAAYGLGLSLGSPSSTSLTLTAIAGAATILARLMWTARRSRMSGFLTAVALPAAYGAVLVALHLATVSAAHIALWAVLLPAPLLVVGTLRHCHWYDRATDARWPLFSLPAACGVFLTVAIGAMLAIRAASLPQPPLGEKFTLAIAAFTAGSSCVIAFLSIIEPQPARVRAAASGAAVTLITTLAAYGTFWNNDPLLWYSVITIVVGFAASTLPRHLSGPTLGARAMMAATAGTVAIAAISAGFVTLTDGPPAPWLTPQTPLLALILAAGGVIVLPQLAHGPFALGLTALAAMAAPVVWPLAWWSGAALTVAIALVAAGWAVFARLSIHSAFYGVVTLLTAGYSLAAATRVPLDASATWSFSALIAAALLLIATVTAILGYRRRPITGGIAVCGGLVLLTLTSVLAGFGWQLPGLTLALVAMTAASLGLLIACLIRVAAPLYLPWASMTVPLTATAAAVTSVDTPYTALFFAASGLIGVAAAMLTLPNRKAVAIRTGLSLTGALPGLVLALPVLLAVYLAPYSWLNAVWTGDPVTTLDGLTPTGADPALADPVPLAVLALTSATVILAVTGLASRTAALVTTAVAIALVVPTAPLTLNLLWPCLPLFTAASAVACHLLLVRARLTLVQLSVSGTIALCAAGAALTGALATSTATIIITALYSVATVTGAVLASGPVRRGTSWALAAAALTGTALAAGLDAGLAVSLTAFGVLTVAALFFALRASGSRVIDGSARAVEIAGHGIAWCGLLLTVPAPTRLAIALVVYGALLGLLALLAPRGGFLAGPRIYTASATVAAFGSYWLLLGTANVFVTELYTVPFALATVVAGWLELRRRPSMRSWTAYGAGLCLGFLPSLALVLLSPDEPWRRLLLGTAAVVVLCLGAWRRSQAPVVITAILLPVVAIREVAALWTYVPSWLPLAVAGVLLLTFGATFEKRRRDLRRLRESVAAMR